MEELEQEINNDGEILSPGEAHSPCVLLLDTSSSMNENQKINSLNNGINRLIEITKKDEVISKIVDLAIIEFNNDVKVIQDFAPIVRISPVNLTATGERTMGKGLVTAIEKIREKRREYNQMGTPCYMPLIFMITDGEPTDDIQQAINLIRIEEHKGKLRTVAIGVPGYNKEILKKISPRCVGVNDEGFEEICTWIAENLINFHCCGFTERNGPKFIGLPENAHVISNYWND